MERFELKVIEYSPDILPTGLLNLIVDNIEARFRFFDSILNCTEDLFLLSGAGGINSITQSLDNEWNTQFNPMGGTLYRNPVTGASFSLEHQPQFDNGLLCSVKHPATGYVLTSYMVDVYLWGYHVFRFEIDPDEVLKKMLSNDNTDRKSNDTGAGQDS